MHLLVLSAFRHEKKAASELTITASQCTFWCSVLSDRVISGRGCLIRVSMHLLVLSAFRPSPWKPPGVAAPSQCTFWCSVLSDSTRYSDCSGTI